MNDHYTKSKLRSFGLIVGGIFLLIAFWPYLRRGHDIRLWATVLGGSLVLLGIVAPSLLRHPYRAWMALAYVLGWINTRLILGVVYYLVFTPVSLGMRLLGKDPMNRKLDPNARSYRTQSETREAGHMKHQF